MSQSKIARLFAPLVVLALLAAACGGSSDESESGSDAEGSETTESDSSESESSESETDGAASGEADESTEEEETSDEGDGTPQRIVSLSATATEMLFAIGAGDRVVATDQYSNYPAEAPTTDLSGFEPNLEAIIGYDPDLVVISYDPGELVTGLEAVGVEVVVHPSASTLDDTYTQIAEFGIITGQLDEAAAVNAEIREGLAEIAASVVADGDPIRIYHELDSTFYSVSSASFLGQVYALLGVENIADVADTEGYGYPQLTAEYIIEANPQVIVITDQGGYTADDVAGRPGWDTLEAANGGSIVSVDADVASRWGPRIVEFAQVIADQLAFEPVG